MADRMAADAAIRRLRRIAPDHLAAITAAADRMRVPVAITAARAADTRVRTEATDAKLDLISILTPPSNLGGDSFALTLRFSSAYHASRCVLCILPDSA